jgi:hypothetical protein
LDISITRNDNFLSFSLYRKPTTTNTIIPNDSCHPPDHKAAVIRFLTNQRDTHNLNDASRTNKNNVIHQIPHNNNYDTTLLHKPPKTSNPPWQIYTRQKNGFILHTLEKKPNLVWNYSKTLQSKYRTQYVTLSTDYFPHTTIPSKTNTKNQVSINWHVPIASKCMLDRLADLFLSDSTYTSGIINTPAKNLNSLNTFWTTTTPLGPWMDILHLTSKGAMMNTLERFHIYSETKRDNQINDRCTVKLNAIFDSITHLNSNQGLPIPH